MNVEPARPLKSDKLNFFGNSSFNVTFKPGAHHTFSSANEALFLLRQADFEHTQKPGQNKFAVFIFLKGFQGFYYFFHHLLSYTKVRPLCAVVRTKGV